MHRSRLILASSCLAALFSFACAAPNSGGSGTGGSSSTGGSTGTGGSSSTGGTTGSGTGGSSATGGTTGAGGVQTGTGGSSHTGGSTGTGGSSSTGGTTGTGGSSHTGGSTGTGGSSSTGGTTGSGGSSSTGGTTGTGGTPGTGGTAVDQGGKALAKPGATTSTSNDYLNLGDMRLLNNKWGSINLNCSGATQSVFINSDKTIGWNFNRGNCGEQNHSNPDFPEVEFGVAPFGKTSSLLTSPAYSSTTLLPIQLSKLTSASVTMDNFSTTFSNPTYWDANFEFWISKNDPTANNDGGVYAEIITFTGWNSTRQTGATTSWACQITGKTVPNSNFSLCHQSDTWASGWRFFNFLAGSGTSNYTGKADIKAILDYIRSQYSGFTDSMYLTRIEVGTEIDDNTAGSSNTKNLTFEVNGVSKSIQLGN
jgi:hypothetical protein